MTTGERIASIEMTVGQAVAVADALSFTWPQVLAVTPQYFDPAQGAEANKRAAAELGGMGLWSGERPTAPLRAWANTVSRTAERWYEVRCLSDGTTLRGVVAQSSAFEAVVAYRHAQFLVLSGFEAYDASSVVPAVLAGLDLATEAAVPPGVSFETSAGKAVDEKVRAGASWESAVSGLGLDERTAQWLTEVAESRGSFVEVTAHCRVPKGSCASKSSVGVFNTGKGRVLIRQNGKTSEVLPGSAFQVAVALDELAASTPLGPWFERSMTKF